MLIEGEREVVAPREVARNVDRYLADLDVDAARARVQAGADRARPVAAADRAPAARPARPDARKKFLEKRFVEEIAERRVLQPLRPIVQALIRTGSQMSYLGYYGDRRSWDSIGYTAYQRAARRPPAAAGRRDPSRRCEPLDASRRAAATTRS